MQSAGLRGSLSLVFPLTAISTVVARLVGGAAIDVLPPKNILSFGLFLQGISMAFMAELTPATVLLAPVVQGLSMGTVMNVASVAYANYFGRAHLGSISGIATSALVIGSALGPFPFGLIRDWTGAFDAAFIGSAVLSFGLAAMVFLLASPPSKSELSDPQGTLKVSSWGDT